MKKKITIHAVMILLMLAAIAFVPAKNTQAAIYSESFYAPVYDYNYFVNKYPSVKATYKTREKVFKYFVDKGMAKGMRASASFNVWRYKANYADLRARFGSDLRRYYLHYINAGKAQGRLAVLSVNNCRFFVTVYPNGGTYNGTTKSTRILRYKGQSVTLKTPVRKGYTFAGFKLSGLGKLSGMTYTFNMDRRLLDNKLVAQWRKNDATVDSKIEKFIAIEKARIGTKGGETWRYWGREAEWCCMFFTMCAEKAGLIASNATEYSVGSGYLPKCAGQRDLAATLQKLGRLKFKSSGYVPRKGDIIFFTKTYGTKNVQLFTHVGLVIDVKGSTVTTIEGNTGTYDRHTSYVKQKTYDLSAERIAAYGIIKK